jgi:hypothetical protein
MTALEAEARGVVEARLLDCENLASAVKSLAGLFGMSELEFRTRLSELEIDFEHASVAPEAQIPVGLGIDDVDALPVATGTKWFHGTRAKSSADFPEGLLPTRDAVLRLLPDLGEIAKQWISEPEWLDYVNSLDSSDREWAKKVREKRRQKYDRGPFAFLVRDVVITADGQPQKPYHKRGSEVLEILCWDFQDVFGRPLLEEYLRATRPCLVAFVEPRCEPRCVRAALSYVYHALHELRLSIWCNTNFDGNGTAVPRERFSHIEWITGLDPGDHE